MSLPEPFHPAVVHFPIALILLGASWFVLEAGHYGGQLVYRHGVGVSQSGLADSLNTDVRKKSRHRDED